MMKGGDCEADGGDLANMSDDEINRRKFAVMQRLCDEKGLPYPAEVVAYLSRKQS